MERAIESASRSIDAYTKRRFWLDVASSPRLYLANGYGVATVDDFVTLTSVTPEVSQGVLGSALDATVYRASPLNAALFGDPYYEIDFGGYYGGYQWGWLSVNAVWGWPAVPAGITQACLMKAARIYKRRESVTGTLGFDEFALRISREDPDVIDLLMPFKWVTVG